MRIQSLVSVKKAAAVLGLDKETIRTKLASGELKGERRRVGTKDKWFVFSAEIEHLVDDKEFLEFAQHERLAIDDMVELFEESEGESAASHRPNHRRAKDSAPAHDSLEHNAPEHNAPEHDAPALQERQHLVVTGPGTAIEAQIVFDQVVQMVTREFSSVLSEEKRRNAELELKLEDQKQMLQVAGESELAANLRAVTLDEELSKMRTKVAELEQRTARSWWQRLLG